MNHDDHDEDYGGGRPQQQMITLYTARKYLCKRIRGTHDPLPNLSAEARAERRLLWARLDQINAKIKVVKNGVGEE